MLARQGSLAHLTQIKVLCAVRGSITLLFNYLTKELIMGVPQAIGLGIIGGIVLFFVLLKYGVIDSWIARLEK
jgi:hypothetical protein